MFPSCASKACDREALQHAVAHSHRSLPTKWQTNKSARCKSITTYLLVRSLPLSDQTGGCMNYDYALLLRCGFCPDTLAIHCRGHWRSAGRATPRALRTQKGSTSSSSPHASKGERAHTLHVSSFAAPARTMAIHNHAVGSVSTKTTAPARLVGTDCQRLECPAHFRNTIFLHFVWTPFQ